MFQKLLGYLAVVESSAYLSQHFSFFVGQLGDGGKSILVGSAVGGASRKSNEQ